MDLDRSETKSRTSLVLCPKCRGECREIWQTANKDGKQRKVPKRIGVVCSKCGYDLSTAKQPKGPLIEKIR